MSREPADVLGQLPAGLVDALADAIADRLAERLAANGDQATRPALIDAAEVATRCGRSREWVYDRRRELGAIALGNGKRPRLGFEPAKVDAYLASRSASSPSAQPPATRDPARQRRSRPPTGATLLPIKGESG